MVAAAGERAGHDVALHVADMRELPCLGRFDLCISLGDSVNYLLDPADLERTFAAVARNLRPGGLFLFDLNTLATYDEVFGADRCLDDSELFFAWRGAAVPPAQPGALAEATIERFAPLGGGCWERASSRHVQRHHPEPLVTAALRAAGFAMTRSYGLARSGGPDGAPDEQRHHKVVHVARTPGDPPRSERR